MKKAAERFDVIVIGGGSAGLSAAFRAREYGLTVAVVEADKLGGECPNWACVPTKAMLRAATLYETMRRDGARMGVKAEKLTLDFPALMRRKDAVVNAITGNGKRLPAALRHDGIELVRGRASFLSKTTIAVGERVFSAKAFVVATGSREYVPPIAGIDEVPYLTFREAVSLKRLPRSIAIIGAGPVGCEFATFFAKCGVRTVLLVAGTQILQREDDELAALAAQSLTHRFVTILPRTKVLSLAKHRKQIAVVYQQGSAKRRTMVADAVLLATGRRPNIEGLHLEKAGVRFDGDGRLKPDAALRIAPHIFVAGDVSGEMLLTHVAHHAGVTAGDNAARAVKKASVRRLKLDVVPRVTFIDPELASVGMTAKEAVAAGHEVAIKRFPIGALGRAVVDGKRDGMCKIVLDEASGKMLGAHILGEHAGEVIHELALAMHLGTRWEDVITMIHAYPTYSEVIPAAM